MKQELQAWRVNHLIYAAGKDLHNTIRTRIALTEPIRADALRKAADLAITRYPYFSVRLVRNGEAYADRFAGILAEYGIHCSLDNPGHFEISDFVLPMGPQA